MGEDGEYQLVRGSVIPSDPRRPARVLINLIDKCPIELILKMSPGSRRLKKNLKVPMIFLCWSCGVVNGCSLVFLKICGEIVNSPEAHNHILFTVLMGAMGGLCAVFNVYALNMSMKYYQNLDVMPAYQSFILMHMILSGLIVLNEAALYSVWELVKLSGSAVLVIAGIYVLTQKKNLVVVHD